jgi:hypothetical protein
VPVGWWNGIKWRLVTTWFSPDKLSPARNYDPATQEFGAWSRFKQYLVRRWLVDLPVLTASSLPTASPSGYVGDVEDMDKDLGAVGELLSIATPVAIAELDPTGASRLQKRVPIERLRSLSPTRSDGGSDDRSASSGGRSGVMVEEKGASEDERSGDEGKRKEDRAREEKDRRKRLDVPLR